MSIKPEAENLHQHLCPWHQAQNMHIFTKINSVDWVIYCLQTVFNWGYVKKNIDEWSHCVSLMFYTACKLSKRHQTGRNWSSTYYSLFTRTWEKKNRCPKRGCRRKMRGQDKLPKYHHWRHKVFAATIWRPQRNYFTPYAFPPTDTHCPPLRSTQFQLG